MRKTFIALALAAAAALCGGKALACTSAIISGKLTADGRPILWKNQDGASRTCVRFHKGRIYDYVGEQVKGVNPRAVWGGTNSAGFCIMNTLSFNLKDASGARNGTIMADALEICATVEDFRHYLDTLSRPMKANANYGVIDAKGGAAYFETGDSKYTEYDVNDVNQAPHGYMVRTNFSQTGEYGQGLGYIRYQYVSEEIYKAGVSKRITPLWVAQTLAHSYVNRLMGLDLRDGAYNLPHGTGWAMDADFVAKQHSMCTLVFQGVKPGEDPSFTTMWAAIGRPSTSPIVPVWVKGAESKLPYVLQTKKGDVWMSPLYDASDSLISQVYSLDRKEGKAERHKFYLHWELLFNRQGTGFMQQCEEMERKMYSAVSPRINAWRAQPAPAEEDIHAVYDEYDAYLTREYRERFGLDMEAIAGKKNQTK